MRDAAAVRRPEVVDTDASSSFACDYVAGINRVVGLPPYLLVDNIGRNVELWQFQPGAREPASRARYDLTSYPDDPIASLLDVDVHAAVLRRAGRELLTVNHYGRLRGFELPAPEVRMRPAWELQLPGDTERIVMAGDCPITSSPRGEFTDDPPQPGIFLFEPIGTSPAPMAGAVRRLAYEQALAGWGVISALAVSAGTRLAAAAGQRLAVFELACGSDGVCLGECLWDAPVPFYCQWLQFDEGARLWAGGSRTASPVATGDNWDTCLGGGIEAFAVDSGARQFTATLPEATAWGYGADPIVLAAGGREIFALGRDASLHVIDVAEGASRRLYDAPAPMGIVIDGASGLSLGIGHAALLDGRIYAGFSRGGFQLWRYDVGPA